MPATKNKPGRHHVPRADGRTSKLCPSHRFRHLPSHLCRRLLHCWQHKNLMRNLPSLHAGSPRNLNLRPRILTFKSDLGLVQADPQSCTPIWRSTRTRFKFRVKILQHRTQLVYLNFEKPTDTISIKSLHWHIYYWARQKNGQKLTKQSSFHSTTALMAWLTFHIVKHDSDDDDDVNDDDNEHVSFAAEFFLLHSALNSLVGMPAPTPVPLDVSLKSVTRVALYRSPSCTELIS